MQENEALLALQTKIFQLEEIVKQKDRLLCSQEELLQSKDIRIENLMQALLHARKKIFGRSREVTPENPEQLSFLQTIAT